jgi:hypothetical protein
MGDSPARPWSLTRSIRWYAGGALLAALLSASGSARAEDTSLQIHGFVSQGFVKTSANNFLANSEDGSFEFTEAGINVTKEVTDRFRVGVQLFTRDLGPIGNYSAQFDWFYLDYRFFDWLGIRAGRTKVPFGLYNETSDVDAARTPVLLPQSLYPVQNRDFLLAQTGLELYGVVPLRDAGDLEYRAYGGTLHYDPVYEGDQTLRNASIPYVVGGRVMWRPPITGLQLGGSLQALKIDVDYTPTEATLQTLRAAGLVPEGFSGVIPVQIPAVLWVGSLEYAPGDLLLAAEYSRWRTSLESPVTYVAPSFSERMYGMVSYRVRPWFVPGMYYSLYFADTEQRSVEGRFQHDLAATLRFDLTDNWLVKVEGHFMHGTGLLTSSLNGDKPLGSLTQDWTALLLKTTAYF